MAEISRLIGERRKLRDALDATTKALEECRNVLVDLREEDDSMPEEARECVEGADATLKLSKELSCQ